MTVARRGLAASLLRAVLASAVRMGAARWIHRWAVTVAKLGRARIVSDARTSKAEVGQLMRRVGSLEAELAQAMLHYRQYADSMRLACILV